MQALKTQIQPHYLYNTLDVIRMTAVEHDDTTTAELLLSLSAQLRYVMGKQNDRVRLADEIQNIQMYFVIAKVRYENRISLEINVADDVRELYVLKLLLQPIVENAVSHGLKPRRGAGKLSLSAQRREDFLEITVMDDGVGIPPQEVEQINQILSYGPQYEDKEHRMGVGMKNVSDRIKINCGSEYGYTVSSYEEIGTVVRFKLPVWEVETDVEGSHS
jgi:two-component system sensor histidine kinase YesM